MTVTAIETEELNKTEIGLLPREWGLATLGDIFYVQQGKALSPKSRQGISPRPFLRTANVLWGHLNLSTVDKMDFSEEEAARLVLKPGDLLVCEGGDIGRTAMWHGELPACYYQNHIHRLRPKTDNASPEYYMYWMQAALLLLDLYLGQANRTTIPNLSGARLKSFVVPVPPVVEQKRIAYFLSTVQEAKEKTEAVIKATREFKKSLMKHLFTYGPVRTDEAEDVPLKETEIGMVPEEWEVEPLVDIATLQRGKDLPKQKQVWGKYPVVGSSGVMAYHNQGPCRGPGVVTGRSGSIGNLTYIEEDYWPHNTGLYVKDFHNNNPKFTYYLLHLIDFRKYATGVSVPTLNRNFVHVAMLPVPPSEVQRHIADILTIVDRRIEAGENKKQALEALFKTLLTRLMTGKIRVSSLEVPV